MEVLGSIWERGSASIMMNGVDGCVLLGVLFPKACFVLIVKK